MVTPTDDKEDKDQQFIIGGGYYGIYASKLEFEHDVANLEQLSRNVISSWQRGDISTKGTALLELANALKMDIPTE